MTVAGRKVVLALLSSILALGSAGCGLNTGDDGETAFSVTRVKQVFVAQDLPLTDVGGPIGKDGQVDRSKYTTLAARDVTRQPALQVLVTVFRDIADARRYEGVANDEMSKAMKLGLGRDEVVLREGNVVVQYNAASQPDRLPKVREALSNLAK